MLEKKLAKQLRRLRVITVVIGFVSLIACGWSMETTGGTVIINASVIDGSGRPTRQGSVRLEGEFIAAVGNVQPRRNDEVIDAKGQVLAPGFIDSHSHHDGRLVQMPEALAVISQGGTTIVVGQDGGQQYPLSKFFASLEQAPVAINVASYAGHGVLRRMAMGEDYQRASTDSELHQMEKLLRGEMESGALGLSTGLEYDPGSFATSGEVVALAAVAAQHGGRYISHFRSEDQYFWEALDEIINIGREADVPVQASPIKLAMQRWWGQADRLIHTLDNARASGVDITADIYPYTAWQTGFSWLLTLFPDRDPSRREGADYILGDMLRPEGIILTEYPAHPAYSGLTVADVAAQRDADPATTLMDLLSADAEFAGQGEDGARSSMLGVAMIEPDIEAIMAWEHANICSDGGLAGAHPRGFGTFTRFLGHYIRERRVASLEEGIRKITSLAAEHVGLVDRGLIKPGLYADLVLFDPDIIIDRSTVQEPHLTSVGIETVWVNGQVVFAQGEVTGRRPGMVIRRANSPQKP